jgi:hypothetical protein
MRRWRRWTRSLSAPRARPSRCTPTRTTWRTCCAPCRGRGRTHRSWGCAPRGRDRCLGGHCECGCWRLSWRLLRAWRAGEGRHVCGGWRHGLCAACEPLGTAGGLQHGLQRARQVPGQPRRGEPSAPGRAPWPLLLAPAHAVWQARGRQQRAAGQLRDSCGTATGRSAGRRGASARCDRRLTRCAPPPACRTRCCWRRSPFVMDTAWTRARSCWPRSGRWRIGS